MKFGRRKETTDYADFRGINRIKQEKILKILSEKLQISHILATVKAPRTKTALVWLDFLMRLCTAG